MYNDDNERYPKRLLHGVLHANIDRIDKLNFGNSITKSIGQTLIYPLKGLCPCRTKIMGYKLYATVDLDKARVARTKTVRHPTRPRWSEDFTIYCAHQVSHIIFTVKDDNPVGATLIGRARLQVDEILPGRPVDRWIDIVADGGRHLMSKIHVQLQFLNVSQDSSWSQGIKAPNFPGVPRTFFKQREGCKVTLYQDAHILHDIVTNLELSSGRNYEPGRCWKDTFDAICNAKHLIYIAGWSVYHAITLVRDPAKPDAGPTLGELLRDKAKENVRVLLLVWDDRTSQEPLKKGGIMQTHDEDTLRFFRGTNVHCVLCPRNPGSGRSIIQDFQVSTLFTHHQKTVVVDAEIPGSSTASLHKRRLVSFLGGIDLCDGRYDRQDHSLFRTLNGVHKHDFHQPNFPEAAINKGGPREPWHDIHCRLEGPVAWDVLYNFEQRWKKQVGNKNLFSIAELYRAIVRPGEAATTSESDPESWNVQIFRSIDDGAPIGFPQNPEEREAAGLVTGKDGLIERSIQDGYINAIRRAKNFIYIENQYFLGSSYGWKPDDKSDMKVEDVGALHLIPKELSLKIVSKIRAGERFSVYVVIPMWPEGEPGSGAVQAILYWQKRTMEMMYTDIADAIREKGLNAHPKDYLSFFCLGNRELLKPELEYHDVTEHPPPDSDYARAQQSRRFMIYVHAKMMVVDDEYIIIGSANINQRSMDGARDTEIAMGAFQPQNLSGETRHAHGQIYGFRMALWYEHLRMIHPSFRKPEKLECMHEVNKMAEENWRIYKADFFDQDLPGHLLPYPVQVTSHGHVMPLDEFSGCFPDTKAAVLGAPSEFLPPPLTT